MAKPLDKEHYDAYMGEGIKELRRLYFEGEERNPFGFASGLGAAAGGFIGPNPGPGLMGLSGSFLGSGGATTGATMALPTFGGNPSLPEKENPSHSASMVGELLPWGVLAVGVYVFWNPLKTLVSAAQAKVATLSSTVAAQTGNPAVSVSSCPAGSYRRADGQIRTLAQIQSELKGAGYNGATDTASLVSAYSGADPTGASRLTAC